MRNLVRGCLRIEPKEQGLVKSFGTCDALMKKLLIGGIKLSIRLHYTDQKARENC
jgi:hypothetical protein